MLRRILPWVVCLALLDVSTAGATFHIAYMNRVLTGLNGTTKVQYVEMVMAAEGQNFVAGAKLIAFKADGTFDHVVMTLPNDVQSGNGRPYLMASADFAAASGITPDFVFNSLNGKGLNSRNGMVCWGKPTDETDPNDEFMIDCVSYGDYTGPPNFHTTAPNTVTPFGHGLVRNAFTGSSAGDFVCENPGMPRNNTPTTGQVAASTPCGACGDGTTDSGEQCDAGAGNGATGSCCSATCHFVIAGTVCRTASGICDVAETCSGSAGGCPANAFAATTKRCRSSAGECDPAETCSGTGATCPSDALTTSDTPCASDNNACTDDVCNGVSAACAHPNNTVACDDGDACTTDDHCTSGSCAGTPDPQCAVTTTTTTLPAQLCGDATGDGKITASDALRALRRAVGSAECTLQVCDYNGDGKISGSDALAILKVATGQSIAPKCPVALLAEVTTTMAGTTTTTVGDGR